MFGKVFIRKIWSCSVSTAFSGAVAVCWSDANQEVNVCR